MKQVFTVCMVLFCLGCDGWRDDYNFINNPDGGTDPDGSSDSDLQINDSSTDGDHDGDDTDVTHQVPQYAELWYSVDDSLVLIQLDPDDGSVENVVNSSITGLVRGQNCLTMLDDGSLLGARLQKEDMWTYFYHIPEPPRDGSEVEYVDLGVMSDDIPLEALYTDCDGRVYGMDTGEDDGSSKGNRLLLFTGNILDGDYSFQVVSDLSVADVADIDDMGPGINEDGEITDNPGFAIDTSEIYDFNYETGTGTHVAKGGTWGIHALGGELFSDGVSRLYVLSREAELFEIDPSDFSLSGVLVVGPDVAESSPGWSGLAGPLTDCETGFILY